MMINKRPILLCFALLWCLCLGNGLAAQDWDDMSLEDLMNVTVTTVSKKAEKASEASAVMTVITADDIKRMGARTLDDVLKTVAGISIIETYYGYSSVTFRGIQQTHYNSKSLLLLNGHPMYETVVGSYYVEAIPVTSISRIEIIRGPGSVMYGTNAFAGVINVITKKGKDINGAEVSTTLGSFSTKQYGFLIGSEKDDFNFSIAGSNKDDDGYKYNVIADEGGASGEPIYGVDRDAYENDFNNTLINVQWDNVSVQLFNWKQEKDKFGLIPRLSTTGESHRKGYGFDVSYTNELTGDREITFFGWYDKMSKTEWIEQYTSSIDDPNNPGQKMPAQFYQEYSGDKFGFDVRYNYPGVAEKTDLLCGFVYEELNSEPYYFKYASDIVENSVLLGEAGDIDAAASSYLQSYSTSEKSFYFQSTYKRDERTTITAGGRFVDNDDTGSDFSPSGGLVYKINDLLIGKLLYGEAYRSANFFEKYVDAEGVLEGDPNLAPEKIETIDLQLNYQKDNYLYQLNPFISKISKLITRIPNPDPLKAGSKYINKGGQEIQGICLEMKSFVSDRFDYFLNITYQEGEDKETGLDINGLEEIAGNLGCNYKVPDAGLNINAKCKYIGDRTLVNGVGGTVDAFQVIDVKLLWEERFPNTDLAVTVYNVFDENYYYPEYIRSNIKEIPGGPGRAIYFSITHRF